MGNSRRRDLCGGVHRRRDSSECHSDAEHNSGSEPYANAHADAYSYAHRDAQADADADSHHDAQAHTHTYSDAHRYSNQDRDAAAYPHANSDAHTNADAHAAPAEDATLPIVCLVAIRDEPAGFAGGLPFPQSVLGVASDRKFQREGAAEIGTIDEDAAAVSLDDIFHD